MINSFDVYWVMQLDTIVRTIGSLSVVALVLSLLAISFLMVQKHSYTKLASISLCVSVGFIILTSFVPSSRTAAAMVVLPAVANSSQVKEIGALGTDLIKLAREAVSNLKEDQSKKEEDS
jgi:hypothetical protein